MKSGIFIFTALSLLLISVFPRLSDEIIISEEPIYLDLGDEVISVGQEVQIHPYKYNSTTDRIFSISPSPDSKKIAMIVHAGENLRLQVWSRGMTATEYFFDLGPRKNFTEFEPLTWSADSKTVAFSAQTRNGSNETYVSRDSFKELTTIKTLEFWQTPIVSPDGRYIAYSIGHEKDITKPPDHHVFITDTFDKKDTDLGPIGKSVMAWPEKDKLFIYCPWTEGKYNPQLVCFNPQTKEKMIAPAFWHSFYQLSPDRRWVFRTTRGLAISPSTKEDYRPYLQSDLNASGLPVGPNTNIYPISWDPKGKFLLLGSDSNKEVNVWIFSLTTLERELVIREVERDQIGHGAKVAISADRKLICYVKNNCLMTRSISNVVGANIAEVKGAKQRETQEKAVITAGIISDCLETWFMKNGSFPQTNGVAKLLSAEFGDNSPFYNPDNPKQLAFFYTPPQGEIQSLEEFKNLCLGYLDWGYGWKVYIYADKHSSIVLDNN